MPAADERIAMLDFLRELRSHNDRDWFEAHRARYEVARAAFQGIVGELIDRFDAVDDLGGVTVKECLFRINRDVRFSKDKQPYKTAMTALLGRGGRKTAGRTYYFHIEPDGRSMLAGGLYDPSPEQLAKMRAALAENAWPLRKILASDGLSAVLEPWRAIPSRSPPRATPRTIPPSISCA